MVRAREWKAPDKYQKKVIALRAQIEELKSQKGNHRNVKQDWKKKAPSDIKATKTYKNREYNWCPKHQMWTVHKAEDCPTRRIKTIKAMRITPKTSGKWPTH